MRLFIVLTYMAVSSGARCGEMYIVSKKKIDQNVFLQYLQQNSGDYDEIWYSVF